MHHCLFAAQATLSIARQALPSLAPGSITSVFQRRKWFKAPLHVVLQHSGAHARRITIRTMYPRVTPLTPSRAVLHPLWICSGDGRLVGFQKQRAELWGENGDVGQHHGPLHDMDWGLLQWRFRLVPVSSHGTVCSCPLPTSACIVSSPLPFSLVPPLPSLCITCPLPRPHNKYRPLVLSALHHFPRPLFRQTLPCTSPDCASAHILASPPQYLQYALNMSQQVMAGMRFSCQRVSAPVQQALLVILPPRQLPVLSLSLSLSHTHTHTMA